MLRTVDQDKTLTTSEPRMMRTDLMPLRVRKDVNELHKAKYICSHTRTRVDFPDGVDNMLRLIFFISVVDQAGPFANGDFTFHVQIPKTYPFQPPEVTCTTRIWHPNVDAATGRVMIAILGKDWRPVLSINTVLLGLQLIFLEPGIDYVMNSHAANQLQRDPLQFRRQAQQILNGGSFFGFDFPAHPRVLEKQRDEILRMKLKRTHDDRDSDHRRHPLSEVSVDDNSRLADVFPLEKHAIMWKRKRLN